MPVINSVAAMKDEIAAWRRELHQNPQTAYEEVFASDFVAKKLTEWNIPFKRGLAKTGLVATIKGNKSDSKKSIGLRADMDALNITEKTGLPHTSKFPGKMHACGHDGHTAMLLGVAKHLSETRNFNGTVHLVFQPAEEGGQGAHAMLKDGLFRDFHCDHIFGLHNWPYMPVGTIGTRVGPLLAAVDEFAITITGKGGHAAMPEKSIDPIIVAAQIITALQTIVSRNTSAIDTAVVTVCNVNAGTGAFNVIGDTAKLNGTVRTFSPEIRKAVRKRLTEITNGIAATFGATAEVDYQEHIDPTINTADGVEFAATAAAAVVGEKNVLTDCEPCMGGEDFGAFLAERPGAFIYVGQGVADKPDSPHNHGLHSPFYDFNDDIIPTGVSYFAKLVETYLKP